MRVAIRWRLAGGVLTLTATTPKRGDVHHDSWTASPSAALDSEAVTERAAPSRSRCVSRAIVAIASLTPDTTYTFSYAVVMRAGDRAWAGNASLTVTVGADGSLAPPSRP